VVDVALSAAPLVDPASNEVIGEICSMRDITEHKLVRRAERELEQNRKLTQLIQSRLEEERRSIARELHDELGQCVTAIKTIALRFQTALEIAHLKSMEMRRPSSPWPRTSTMWCTESSASCGPRPWTTWA